MVRNNGVVTMSGGGSCRLPVTNGGGAGDGGGASGASGAGGFADKRRRTQSVRYRRRSRRQGPSISQLVPVLLEGKQLYTCSL